jgi:Cu/Ag efflux pump CusA
MPGTSLQESSRVAARAEAMLLEMPEVVSVSRRTGRAELDEHAEGVHSSELDVRLVEHERPLPGWWPAVVRAVPGLHHLGVERTGRPHDVVMEEVRDRLSEIPGVKVNVGQPIAHRLDHVLTGVRAQVVIKVHGPDLSRLRALAHEIEERLGKDEKGRARIPGITDLQVEPLVEVPQVAVRLNRAEASRHGLTAGDVAAFVETAFKGRRVAVLVDQDRSFDLVVWFDDRSRATAREVARTLLDTPSGRKVALGQVADVVETTGPNAINRERVARRIVVSCNVQGRDLGSVVAEIERQLDVVRRKLAGLKGYRIVLEGQFEAQQEATKRLMVLGTLAVLGVFGLLTRCLGSWRAALQVLLVNLPLAALGSVIALMLINRPDWAKLAAAPWWRWPEVWASATTLSLAHWVGFITLIGIVSRNGIMMISHYIHLMKHEGESFGKEMIVRGSLERLAPVLMTALVAIIGLVPLALGAGQPGKEILHPLAIVVIGGLLDSTLMDQIVTPVVFYLFGEKVYQPGQDLGEAF